MSLNYTLPPILSAASTPKQLPAYTLGGGFYPRAYGNSMRYMNVLPKQDPTIEAVHILGKSTLETEVQETVNLNTLMLTKPLRRKTSTSPPSLLNALEIAQRTKGASLNCTERQLLIDIDFFIQNLSLRTESKKLSDWYRISPSSGQLTFNTAALVKSLKKDLVLIQALFKTRLLLDPSLKTTVAHSIFTELESSMQNKFHHTTLHARIMADSTRQKTRELLSVFFSGAISGRGHLDIAYLIALSHDVIQAWQHVSEFQSALFLIRALKAQASFALLEPKTSFIIFRWILQSICCFTNVNFLTGKTLGEEALDALNSERPSPTLAVPWALAEFGKNLAYDDLFSKINWLGSSENFERLVIPLYLRDGEELRDSDRMKAALFLQMYQMNREFKSKTALEIKSLLALSTPHEAKLKQALSRLVKEETAFFWAEGKYPNKKVKELLQVDETQALYVSLLDFLQKSRRIPYIVLSLLRACDRLGNPSEATLNFFMGRTYTKRFSLAG